MQGTLHGILQVNIMMVKPDSTKGVTLLKSGEDKDFAVKKHMYDLVPGPKCFPNPLDIHSPLTYTVMA